MVTLMRESYLGETRTRSNSITSSENQRIVGHVEDYHSIFCCSWVDEQIISLEWKCQRNMGIDAASFVIILST